MTKQVNMGKRWCIFEDYWKKVRSQWGRAL